MRVSLLLAVVLCLTVPWAIGCGPAIPASEMGETVFQVPKVPGAEEAYPLPECKAQEPIGAPPRPRL